MHDRYADRLICKDVSIIKITTLDAAAENQGQANFDLSAKSQNKTAQGTSSKSVTTCHTDSTLHVQPATSIAFEGTKFTDSTLTSAV